jgi:hypothetical protein
MIIRNLTLKTCSLAVLLVGSLLGTQSILAAPILINGSLTGAIANSAVPTGWTMVSSSPDTMDENNNVGGAFGGFGATPTASADGGTWVGIADNGGSLNEMFGQTVSGFDIGTTYNVSW